MDDERGEGQKDSRAAALLALQTNTGRWPVEHGAAARPCGKPGSASRWSGGSRAPGSCATSAKPARETLAQARSTQSTAASSGEAEPALKVYDISLPLSDRLPSWPGDPKFERKLAQSIERGDAANVSRLEFGAHTGTHVDAPVHFLPSGYGVDEVPLDALIGPCLVVEAAPSGSQLQPSDLPDAAVQRVLFKTRNSGLWAAHEPKFDRDFVSVGLELAQRLVERQVKLVGMDYLSVESFHAGGGHPVHHTLLQARIAIVEGLDLSAVPAGEYQLYCLPLKLAGADGGPARVVLVA